MEEMIEQPKKRPTIRQLPRNVWAVGFTSFFMDISSEMVINILPLFLANVLGVQTSIIGLIEGIAEATASILKLFSGWLSDKLGGRKWLAVIGYGLSAVTKPFFYFASTWELIAGVRWSDRIGKGIRTAPRDALVADSTTKEIRGLAFGFHRAMDTAGAMVGLIIAALVVWLAQANNLDLYTAHLPDHRLDQPAAGFPGSFIAGGRCERCGSDAEKGPAKILLAEHGQTVQHFPGHRQHLHAGEFVGCIPCAACSKPWHFRARHHDHAGDVQPDLFSDLHTGRIPFRPDRPPAVDHRGMAGVCIDLPGLWPCTIGLAGVAAICGLWIVLWHGLWYCQRTGSRPGARESARYCIWHLQCRHRDPGVSRFADCRFTLAGIGCLERIWPIGAVLLWRNSGFDRGPSDGLLDAESPAERLTRYQPRIT